LTRNAASVPPRDVRVAPSLDRILGEPRLEVVRATSISPAIPLSRFSSIVRQLRSGKPKLRIDRRTSGAIRQIDRGVQIGRVEEARRSSSLRAAAPIPRSGLRVVARADRDHPLARFVAQIDPLALASRFSCAARNAYISGGARRSFRFCHRVDPFCPAADDHQDYARSPAAPPAAFRSLLSSRPSCSSRSSQPSLIDRASRALVVLGRVLRARSSRS
jgi:hypothetical protein